MQNKWLAALFFILFNLCANYSNATTPECAKGIWANNDRIIFLGENNQISIILKLYYGWYYDRTCENEEFDSIEKRKKNNTTSPVPVRLNTKFKKLSDEANAFEMDIFENEKLIDSIPFCIIDDELYLNFLMKDDSDIDKKTDSQLYGYWKGVNARKSIKVSGQDSQKEITSWFICEDGCYRLRFWQTDMKYDSNAIAAFTDADKVHSIKKHINTAGKTFTCANGKSGRIRNMEKFKKLPFELKFDKTKKICVWGKPDFKKIKNKSSRKELISIINEANSRICPIPPSPFPVSEFDFENKRYKNFQKEMTKTDFHWDLIDELEKDIEEIQILRKKQEAFGPRGKDFGM